MVGVDSKPEKHILRHHARLALFPFLYIHFLRGTMQLEQYTLINPDSAELRHRYRPPDPHG